MQKITQPKSKFELRLQMTSFVVPILIVKALFFAIKTGDIKRAHFAHKSLANCDYAEFDRSDSEEIKKARLAIYNTLLKKGFDVILEHKIPYSRRYAHLLVKNKEGDVVVQISTEATSANYISNFNADCENAGYCVQWLLLGDTTSVNVSIHNHFAIRYQYNESKYKDLFVIDKDSDMVSLTRADKNDYSYKGRTMYRHSSMFHYVKEMENVTFVNGNIRIEGFEEAYQDWLNKNNAEFENFKKSIDAEEEERERKLKETMERLKNQQNVKLTKPEKPKPPKKTYRDHLFSTGEFTMKSGFNSPEYFHYTVLKKNTDCEYAHFRNYEEMAEKFENVLDGRKTDMILFLSRLNIATPEEANWFAELYNNYTSDSNMPPMVTDILNYIIEETGIADKIE